MLKYKIANIILAAGESKRLGRPKQLLEINSETLIERITRLSMNSKAISTTVVLGANAESISSKLSNSQISITINHNWKEGLGSSIVCGVNAVLKNNANIDAVLLLLCDQPHVDTQLLNSIIEEYNTTQSTIINCDYGNESGPPVLFDKTFFSQLLELSGQTGAKNIINQNLDLVTSIPFAKGRIDIDTESEYNSFINNKV